MSDLFEDLKDGQNLICLLEMLSGQTLPRERGRMRVHQLQNIQIALNYIKLRKVRLVNIRPEDIVDGNQKLTLGLIWTIILHFQVSSLCSNLNENLLEGFAPNHSRGGGVCKNFARAFDSNLLTSATFKPLPGLFGLILVDQAKCCSC